jgi:energy-coupling factor transporter ATP-binding protein EcfA2
MITQLKIKNFTVFADTELHCGRQLNVILGENGTGKSHLLKLAYTILSTCARGEKDSGLEAPTDEYLATALAKKLRAVFRPDELGRLTRRSAGRVSSELVCDFAHGPLNIAFSFHTASKGKVDISRCPTEWIYKSKMPTFIPTRELISLGTGFISAYDNVELPFDETWRDTALLLNNYLAKGPRIQRVKELLDPLEALMGGTLELEPGGNFYLNTENGSLEMHLLAEGMRKIAMLARLIATGAFLNKGYLFWDEPEANLNPKVIKDVARTIMHLAQNNIQVFVATHSLFLMRELHILGQEQFNDVNARYFGLHKGQGGVVTIEQGETIDEAGDITALDEELQQSDRYLSVEKKLLHQDEVRTPT